MSRPVCHGCLAPEFCWGESCDELDCPMMSVNDEESGVGERKLMTNRELADAIKYAQAQRGTWRPSEGDNPWLEHIYRLLDIQFARAKSYGGCGVIKPCYWCGKEHEGRCRAMPRRSNPPPPGGRPPPPQLPPPIRLSDESLQMLINPPKKIPPESKAHVPKNDKGQRRRWLWRGGFSCGAFLFFVGCVFVARCLRDMGLIHG